LKEFAAAEAALGNRVQLRYLQDATIHGLAAARNRAMDVASGDVWVFFDNDVYLETNFLEQLLVVYGTYPHVGGVSGIITNYKPASRVARFWNMLFARGPFRDERQPIYWKAKDLRSSAPVQVRKFTGALMSFRADLVREMRFDDKLWGVSDGEDVDFCARLKSGTVLVIAPNARLEHRTSPIGRLRDHWLRKSARANFYLYAKNWKTGIVNRLCFCWLSVGYLIVATVASLRRGSLEPWRALLTGVREARMAVS
jgi:GT2 family glycosyltransferase